METEEQLAAIRKHMATMTEVMQEQQETINRLTEQQASNEEGPQTFTRKQIKAMSPEEYSKHKNAILAAYSRGEIVDDLDPTRNGENAQYVG